MTSIASLWSRKAQPEQTLPSIVRKRVLVVEDELVIGMIAAEALEDAGFEVLTAASAEEAEVILSQEPVDVLFTDIDLGGRDGCELAGKALGVQPWLSVVFASGRSRRCHGGRVPAEAPFLAKPYRLSDMIAEIDRAAIRAPYQ
jgi:DNA-binding NtrC family response regulator